MKNLKKVLAIVLAVIMMAAVFTACGEEEKETLKVGFIFLHDEQSTYDKNFMDAAKKACDEMGVEYAQKTQANVSFGNADAASGQEIPYIAVFNGGYVYGHGRFWGPES